MRAFLLLLWSIACTEPTEVQVDADGDGVVSARDCDDADATIGPRAPELCDGIDNDCDAVIDDADTLAEGLLLYQDADLDGFGDPEVGLLRCAITPGWVDDKTDCDDTSGAVHIGADEVCDDLDNDCDGHIDDVDADLVGDIIGYWDGDGDGFGTSLSPDTFCELLPDWSLVVGDCDDTNELRYPGAEELCDGLDNDCDQRVDGPGTDDAVHGFRDADGDGHGDRADDIWTCVPVAGYVLQGDDCDDTEPLAWRGATERCDRVDNDCDGVVDGPGAVGAVQAFRDADQDGYGDPAVFAWACNLVPGSVGNSEDCDDADPLIRPGAAEVCDQVDNDCDGTVDGRAVPGARRAWTDADGDGFGDPLLQSWLCTPQAGTVLNNEDCDDMRADVYPGAPELCGDGDTDCDPLTLEDGMVAWRPEVGDPVDLSAVFQAGTDLAPAQVSLDEPGHLQVCPGTYVASLDVTASVEIEGVRAVDLVVLRAPGDRVVDIRGDGLNVTVRRITLREGGGDPLDTLDGLTFGGALACQGGSVARLDNVRIQDSVAGWGGGAAFVGCRANIDDSSFTGNTADWGGALLVRDTRAIVTRGRVIGNAAALSGGGAVVWEEVGEGELIFDRTIVVDNTGLYAGGVHLYAGGSPTLSCRGELALSYGIARNTGTISGAVQSDAPGFSLVSELCDWGTTLAGDDNNPSDIACPSCGWSARSYEDDASFTCDQAGCTP
jgi:hypothetical protein